MEGNAGNAGLLASACFLSSAAVGPIRTLRNLNYYLHSPLSSWKEKGPMIPRNTGCLPSVVGEAFAGTSSFGMSGTNAHALILASTSSLNNRFSFSVSIFLSLLD
jgi:acyl transferase domain-containing protein